MYVILQDRSNKHQIYFHGIVKVTNTCKFEDY